MKVVVHQAQVLPMLTWLEKLAEGQADREALERMLESEDYAFEFARYKKRVTREEFREYLLNLPQVQEEQIQNLALQQHHFLWKDALEHLQKYREGYSQLQAVLAQGFEQKTQQVMERCYGPVELGTVGLVITLGIGPSFGYPYGDRMHMDFLQLIGENYLQEIQSTFQHELHHILFTRLYGEGDASTLEGEFCFFLAGEGLAIKFANFAQGVLSDSICPAQVNRGLDEETIALLNADFENTWKHFADTIHRLREGRMDREALEREMQEYWQSPYLDPQHPGKQLLQSRMYTFGNEVWGCIYDAFGRKVMLDTLRHPDRCVQVFSDACRQKGKARYTVD